MECQDGSERLVRRIRTRIQLATSQPARADGHAATDMVPFSRSLKRNALSSHNALIYLHADHHSTYACGRTTCSLGETDTRSIWRAGKVHSHWNFASPQASLGSFARTADAPYLRTQIGH